MLLLQSKANIVIIIGYLKTNKVVIMIENLTNEDFSEALNSPEKSNILIDKLVNDWMLIASNLPDPNPLFGTIWAENEVSILFSNTGNGKSILGVQLGDAISYGKKILGLNSTQKRVIYFDFELSAKPFQRRYSVNGINYQFHPNFIRAEIDRAKPMFSEEGSYEELILKSINNIVTQKKSEVIIIDNISFLAASNEKSKEALALMKLILNLSREKNRAILLIAHTPKRDIYKPIQLEDLAGSKALSNFCDTVFCIGESVKGSEIRYIKELKNRNNPIKYHSENVMVCQLKKIKTFLGFELLGFGLEKDHLQVVDNAQTKQLEKIEKLVKQGLPNTQIAQKLGISEKTVRRRKQEIGI